jgi:prepilin-type N-terminal cleavage/methylation domain-containing protein
MKNRSRGFTIIEVMIVLAIAGTILLIVFLAIPALQRSERNHNRKEAVYFVWSEMHEYYNNNHTYPLVGTATCAATPECTAFSATLTTQGPENGYDVAYLNNGCTHKFPYDNSGCAVPVPGDTHEAVYIFPAHRCQRDPAYGPGSTDYPIYSLGPSDNDFRRFAVYMILEPDKAYCLDDIS